MLNVQGHSSKALPKEVVDRMDKAVRAVEGDWTFAGTDTGKIGQLNLWKRGDQEIRVTTIVFETQEDAQNQVKDIVARLSISTRRLSGVGDVAYITDGGSTLTHVYASVGAVLLHVSVPASQERGRRVAEGVSRELAER